MKLQAPNDTVAKYGYPLVMEYDNKDFHGTVKGVSIGILDKETGEVVENYVSGGTDEEKAKKLADMLADKDMLLIEDHISQLVNGELRTRLMYMIPYACIEHSIYKPGVIFENISGATNVVYDAAIEILLVDRDGELNRYLNITEQVVNLPVFDIVNGFIEDDHDQQELRELGFKYSEHDTEDGGPGWYLDFYDKGGSQYNVYIGRNFDSIRYFIVAFRLTGLECHIVD